LFLSSFVAFSADSGALVGTVVDTRTGEPIAGATVRLLKVDKETTSNDAGEFELREIPEGSHAVEVSALRHESQVVRAMVSPDEVQILEVQLAPTLLFTEEVFVTASRSSEPVKKLTQGAGIIDASQIALTKTLGLNEVLNEIPGVKAESQAETEQARISMRGRGVRTAFGVRGIKILVDGIPESDGSGETPDLTGIDLGFADRIEVVKGPMSSQYGASASGVVNIMSVLDSQSPVLIPDVRFGSFDFVKTQVRAEGSLKPVDYLLNAARTTKAGHREHSRLLDYRVSSKFQFDLGSDSLLSIFARGSHNDSELPGPLSQEEFDENPKQASPIYAAFDSRSIIDRFLVGASFDKRFSSARTLSAKFFGRSLDFELPVPFVVLDGERDTFGGSLRFSFNSATGGVSHGLALGTDVQSHNEARKDYENQGGTKGSTLFRDEMRDVDNVSLYLLDEIDLSDRLNFNLGANYSQVHYAVDDFVLVDGSDDSGAKTFKQVTFLVGGAYELHSRLSVYASVSTGFEPPTISEIGRDPQGGGGFNQTLDPQRSTSLEAGGLWMVTPFVSANVAVFRMDIMDEIVPTGTGFPQEVFANAAETEHNGVEIGVGMNLPMGVSANLAYTYSDFYFREYVREGEDFAGNEIPGIPKNRLGATFQYMAPAGFYTGIRADWVGAFYADDGNVVQNPEYFVAHWFVGGERLFGRARLNGMFGIDNLFDERYAEYVVINDRFGSFFYPSPERNYFGRLALTWYF
jgi:iron complex outermembrane receptor protein